MARSRYKTTHHTGEAAAFLGVVNMVGRRARPGSQYPCEVQVHHRPRKASAYKWEVTTGRGTTLSRHKSKQAATRAAGTAIRSCLTHNWYTRR